MKGRVILKKQEAINRLKELKTSIGEDIFNSSYNDDTTIFDAYSYLSTIIALLETSTAEKVRLDYLSDHRTKKNKKIVHVILPNTMYGIWDKFLDIIEQKKEV